MAYSSFSKVVMETQEITYNQKEAECRDLIPKEHLPWVLVSEYSWIGRPIQADKKVNLPMSEKGYDNSETTVGKLSARRIQIFWVYFSVIIF